MTITRKINRNKTLPCDSYGISHVGKVRKLNEDAMLEHSKAGLWAVADGMGGHSAGDKASQMIVKSLAKISSELPLDESIDEIENRMLDVNQQLLEMAQSSSKKITIGSTVIILIAYHNYCVYLWAGDSRLYRLRNNELRQITTDHSQVENYVERGLISREEALVHPYGNMITRAIGASEKLFLDMDIQEIEKGDRYLLCSDGLTKHIFDIEFENILQETSAKKTCQRLIDLTLSRGANDNVTAIVVDFN